MKFKLISLYITLFWLALFIAGIWVFSILFRASPVPEFGTGLIGGVIYGLVMRGLGGVVVQSAQDFFDEWRNGLSKPELKAIRAGLADVEAEATVPPHEARQRLWEEQERERIQRQEVCSDKSHWRKEERK